MVKNEKRIYKLFLLLFGLILSIPNIYAWETPFLDCNEFGVTCILVERTDCDPIYDGGPHTYIYDGYWDSFAFCGIGNYVDVKFNVSENLPLGYNITQIEMQWKQWTNTDSDCVGIKLWNWTANSFDFERKHCKSSPYPPPPEDPEYLVDGSDYVKNKTIRFKFFYDPSSSYYLARLYEAGFKLDFDTTCGDDVCSSPYENVTNCPEDCVYCGDEICNPYWDETPTNCCQDCGALTFHTCVDNENKLIIAPFLPFLIAIAMIGIVVRKVYEEELDVEKFIHITILIIVTIVLISVLIVVL